MTTINGGNGSDNIPGTGVRDRLTGDNGNDTLSGFDDNDTLLGGNGDDLIIGGDDLGDSVIGFTATTLTSFGPGDVLTGGHGNDTFRYDGTNDDQDLITDFKPGNDRLEISGVTTAQQVMITDGVLGAGLLILTDSDDGLFLQGVTAPLVVGTDLFFT